MDDIDVEQVKLQLERERFEWEKRRAKHEDSFFNRHFHVIITAVISISAVLISGVQVYVAHIEKKRDIELIRSLKPYLQIMK